MEASLETPLDDLCRDDRCPILDLHFKHRVNVKPNRDLFTCNPQYWVIKSGRALHEAVLSAISLRECVPAKQIHNRVLNDYGSVSFRTVNRVISKLVKNGFLKQITYENRDNLKGCGYSRPDNPLLISNDMNDLVRIQKQLEERNSEAF